MDKKNMQHIDNKEDNKTDKKTIVLGPKKTFPIYMVVAFILAIIGLVYFMTGNVGSEESDAAEVPDGSFQSEYEYALNLFDDGKPHYYQFKAADGITVRYYILKSSDGVIRAAFDACDVCWPAGKGYVQEGDTMVCRNCGRAFSSTQINEVKGGCNPSPLRRSITDGKVVILTDDILKGSRYFNVQAGR